MDLMGLVHIPFKFLTPVIIFLLHWVRIGNLLSIFPSDPNIYAQWEGTNMGDVFGIAIDNQKNAYFAASCSFSPFNSGSAGSGGDIQNECRRLEYFKLYNNRQCK
jgi:hypothetical protein